MIESIAQNWPPGLLLIVAALPVVLLPNRFAQGLMLLMPILGLWQLLSLPAEFDKSIEVFQYSLQIVRVDALSRVFGIVFHIAV